jgi:two-component system, NtrC family, response regulator AtoC
MALRRVLVVDDEEALRHVLTVMLTDAGYDVRAVGRADAALGELEASEPDVVLTDVRMPGMSGLELLAEIRRRAPDVTVIVMSAYGSLETAVEAMKAGAYDYVSKPFRQDEVVLVLRKAEERQRLVRENRRLKADRAAGIAGMIGRSAAFEQVLKLVRKVAEVKTTTLVLGESGTGKELVARALHDLSPRRDGPFLAVNCGAIPEPLMESELFGHVRGAFTDAHQNRKGLFEEADGGTLFLDEVGELPPALQVKLLRVLQEEEIRRVGDTRSVKVEVRVVAATVRDLPEEVKKGRFREDLFYRLNVVQVRMPPLRERREDIPLLLEHFLRRCAKKLGQTVEGFTPEAMRVLESYSWPGNVRELENVVERAVVLAEGPRVDVDGLPEKLLDDPVSAPPSTPAGRGDLSIKRAGRAMEQDLIRRALAKTNGNRTRAAELLDLSHRALLYKLKEYGIT